MKIKHLFYIGVIITTLTTGCDKLQIGNSFLEKAPSSDVTIDTIFSSLKYAQKELWGAYTTLPYGLNLDWSGKGNKLGMDILEGLTDLNQSYLSWGGIMQLYYNGVYDAGIENSSIATKYGYTTENSWLGIRKSWTFIENADRIPDADAQTKKALKAEARMIIAVHYCDMYRNYGGLPWVNHAYIPTEDTNLPRLTSRATMDSIVALIDKAILDLPWKIDDPSNWDGRFTQASAMGLKARVLLFGASPLFNDNAPYLDGTAAQQKLVWNGSYDASLWKKAADAAKALIDKVISQGGYQLVNTGNPRKDFQDGYYKRGTGELLISTRVRYQSPGYWDANYYFYQSAGGYGCVCPTQNYVDMFGMANGRPITDATSGYDPKNPYVNRDPRLYETVQVNGDYYQGRTVELWIGGRERTNATGTAARSGYGPRKFWLEGNTSTSVGSVVEWPYLRLPEIYLSYAEATNEVNNGPTADAYQYVNLVRNRVGLSNLPTGLSKDAFRKAVLNERACEFGFEEVRWYDLIRWKMVDEFTKTLHGMDITKATNGQLTYTLTDLPVRYWKTNWSPKWYLSAFPTNEINKAYGLVQNPGW
ncbi:MAG: RagB/SusD family nutrient uptake outer membrane protein [Prolixibacteraceae bacterium]